jgi:hypothetical protein
MAETAEPVEVLVGRAEEAEILLAAMVVQVRQVKVALAVMEIMAAGAVEVGQVITLVVAVALAQ